MSKECSIIINYNNSDNIYTLTTAEHFQKTRWGPTDRPTYRAAIAAKNEKMGRANRRS